MQNKSFNEREVQKELLKLYKFLPETKRLLFTFGCDAQTTEDLFQEALIIYLRKKNELSLENENSAVAYLKQTCKLLWYNEMRKLQKSAAVELKADVPEEEIRWIEKELNFKQMESVLGKIGKQCKELLQSFYTWNLSMTEIAKKLGLRNEKVAKTQKYRCLQKAKDLVAQASLDVESVLF